jgi:YtkA-like
MLARTQALVLALVLTIGCGQGPAPAASNSEGQARPSVFSMPAMNMPAMRAEAKLSHVEGGRYQGMGQLSMSGTWNVTVTATRDGEPIARRSFSIVAK